jgi:hypothetical protein
LDVMTTTGGSRSFGALFVHIHEGPVQHIAHVEFARLARDAAQVCLGAEQIAHAHAF